MTDKEKAQLLVDYIAYCTQRIKGNPEDERNYGEMREALARLRELVGLEGETDYRYLGVDAEEEQYYRDITEGMAE